MSLNWDATKVRDARAIGVGIEEDEMTAADKIEWAKTEHIIFASMVTGLGKKWDIGNDDVDELFDRLSAYEYAVGSPVRFMGDNNTIINHWLTYDDVSKRVGLRVNVAPVTRAKFERTLGQILMRHAAERRRS